MPWIEDDQTVDSVIELGCNATEQRVRRMAHAWLLCCLITFIASVGSSLQPTRLRCNHLEEPIGVDALPLKLSWNLHSDLRSQVRLQWKCSNYV